MQCLRASLVEWKSGWKVLVASGKVDGTTKVVGGKKEREYVSGIDIPSKKLYFYYFFISFFLSLSCEVYYKE